jgi:hypothetical protein
MNNSQTFFAIEHPTKGIVGDTALPFPNEDEPNKVKIYAASFFESEEYAKAHQKKVWEDCEVVPVTISW